MKRGSKFIIFAIICFFLIYSFNIHNVKAQEEHYDIILSNSQDWRDVYSVMLYASLVGSDGRFITSTRHGSIIFYSIPRDKSILIVSSKKDPYVAGFKAMFEAKGYDNVDEIFVRNANLELAKKLSDVNKFIIVDDAYGYHAIAAAPYAVVSRSYVLLVNKGNLPNIISFLDAKKPEKVILFGHLDRDVRAELMKYNPEIIDTGDRFDDNIEIVKKYLEINPRRQVVMTSGEFIEATFFTGQDPVLFIGKANVPPQIRDFIKNSDFITAVLVGNELINTATFIRRQIGISVFVKFAQSARVPAGTINRVEDLDRFWMPRFELNLTISRIVYNRATKSLDVTYHNPSPVPIYFKSTITINASGNQIVVGDESPVFLDRGDYKTIPYVLDEPLTGNSAKAHIYAIYGEGKRSMEYLLEKDYNISYIEINDEALLNITDVKYDLRHKRFVIELFNPGNVKAFADVEVVDVWVDGQYITASSPEIVALEPHRSKKVYIDMELTEEDISMNEYVRVKAYYGENKNALIKVIYAELPFVAFTPAPVTQIAIGVVVVIILLLLVFLIKRCKSCGAINYRFAKRCRNCGERL